MAVAKKRLCMFGFLQAEINFIMIIIVSSATRIDQVNKN